jgi:hypothetical protein
MAVLGLHRDLHDTSGPIVIHSPWLIRTHLGRAFDFLTLRPGGFAGHGVLLAQKRHTTLSIHDSSGLIPTTHERWPPSACSSCSSRRTPPGRVRRCGGSRTGSPISRT